MVNICNVPGILKFFSTWRLVISFMSCNSPWVSTGQEVCFHFLAKIFSTEAYKTKSGPVLFCQCKAWTLTLKDKHILKLQVGRVFIKMFTHNTEKQNCTNAKEKLHDMHSIHHYGDEIRSSRWDTNVTYMQNWRIDCTQCYSETLKGSNYLGSLYIGAC